MPSVKEHESQRSRLKNNLAHSLDFKKLKSRDKPSLNSSQTANFDLAKVKDSGATTEMKADKEGISSLNRAKESVTLSEQGNPGKT